MARIIVTNLGRLAVRSLATRSVAAVGARTLGAMSLRATTAAQPLRHSFSSAPRLSKPLSSEDLKIAQPANITDSEYHEIADRYLDGLLTRYEHMAESRVDMDIEYSAGVMNLTLMGKGTYVINKQPPNKQIWLSSPVSGPKRYDWVVTSEGQHQKQDTATGDWVYLRDGSTLNELLLQETGVDMASWPAGTK
ncbi:mitochondrial chaperone Frataxin [Xylariaceae sp. FL0255]|nr:mitochondrial chaperone Frataxin [Xylariaceae sp. FL0255]